MVVKANYDDLKNQIADLIEAAMRGDKVIITKNGQQIIQLVTFPADSRRAWLWQDDHAAGTRPRTDCRAREDVTYPIPMVFNLASWTEKLTLADWLAQELNNLYSVPRKTAPDWVKGNKLLLLLDGLDEVRQESRAKCVEAINAFRKEHGLTSLAVCSRSQDYADLNAKLSFEGAIEVQPL
ncbi:MAG: type II toxin-antitoxin system prevent-host-death family antitoxin, partial [Anaerolineales bacterium]|nr:type II toxin-antitoxin system prevent-host-death family antitoxin [Anaerolineales bacterium]